MATSSTKEVMPFELGRDRNGRPVTHTSEINHGDEPLDQSIGGRDTKVNGNSSSIEAKVNALISVAITIIQNVVWWEGVPYDIPQQLLSELNLLRIGNASQTTSVCGQAICGQAICGNS